MELLKIILGNQKAEFSIVGVPNVEDGSVKFQGLMNGIPFTQSYNYARVRERVTKAITLNMPEFRGLS